MQQLNRAEGFDTRKREKYVEERKKGAREKMSKSVRLPKTSAGPAVARHKPRHRAAVPGLSDHSRENLQVGRDPLGLCDHPNPIRGFDVDFPGNDGDITPQREA